MKKNVIISIILVVIAEAAVLYFGSDKNFNQTAVQNSNQTVVQQAQIQQKQMPIITLKTNLGDIKIELFEKDAPKTVANFIKLSKEGFYNGARFHRVIKGFMIQGGDPNSKDNDWSNDGMGGPGYQFEDELNFETESYKAGYLKGVVAMANSGPNTNGSQFFIMLENYPLPRNYTIFGKVIEGQDVVDKIGDLKTYEKDNPRGQATIIDFDQSS